MNCTFNCFQAHINFEHLALKEENTDDIVEAIKFATSIFHLELKCHKGDLSQTHQCIKNKLGTNEKSKKFYSLLEASVHFELTKKNILKKYFHGFDTIGLMVKNKLRLALHLALYSWDLIKDVYFLIAYAKFFPISRNPFASFSFQIFFILLLSILIPVLLHTIIILTEKTAKLSYRGKIILGSFPMLSQPVIAYAKDRLLMLKEKKSGDWSWTKPVSRLDENLHYLDKLLARLRNNEGIFESSIQAVVLLIAIAFTLRFVEL
jgi:hypothetical protein